MRLRKSGRREEGSNVTQERGMSMLHHPFTITWGSAWSGNRCAFRPNFGLQFSSRATTIFHAHVGQILTYLITIIKQYPVLIHNEVLICYRLITGQEGMTRGG